MNPKLSFLGVGNFFTLKDFHTNMMITTDAGNLIVDVGNKIDLALNAKGMSYLDVDAIYISHLHADHAGGIEHIGFGTYFDLRYQQRRAPHARPKLFCQTQLMKDLWARTLSGGMRSVQGKQVDLESYFDTHGVASNDSFSWGGLDFSIIQVVHIMDGYSIIPSFGLMVHGQKKVFITTDTQFNPHQIKTFYNEADIIIHDCECTQFMSGVHANYAELKTLPAEVKAKMWLAHYQDVKADNIPKDAKEDGFLGWATRDTVVDL